VWSAADQKFLGCTEADRATGPVNK
jgi:hypothetical protein